MKYILLMCLTFFGANATTLRRHYHDIPTTTIAQRLATKYDGPVFIRSDKSFRKFPRTRYYREHYSPKALRPCGRVSR